MRTAVKYVIFLLSLSVFLASCGRAEAETVLLDSGEKEAGEASLAEDTPAAPTETPVIQVVCNCRCTGGPDTEAAADDAAAEPAVVSAAPAQTAAPEEGKVNINTADAARLQTLNGIGETRAQAIISYREAHGAFQTIEDIKNVQGIKDGVYSKIKDDISV